ncbi:hypothetical protein TWF694_006054 [Orbilia ellipsospora]|uniref:Nucleoside phosphorylase domain-containing protein n=1 Tax=Orbilia ellipsospora TaxID=2528407 RepID=A0AAV9WS05_9PEZI
MESSNSKEIDIIIICALPLEAKAVEAIFDERYVVNKGVYIMGRIGSFKVVLALTQGMGKAQATKVATTLEIEFRGTKLVLLVGICGGIPFYDNNGIKQEIILGDIAISDQVVQYDFGRKYPDSFVRKDMSIRSNRDTVKLLGRVEKGLAQFSGNTFKTLKDIQRNLSERFRYPGTANDWLFESSYRHKHYFAVSCDACAKCKSEADRVCEESVGSSCQDLGCRDKLINRKRLETDQPLPTVHIGKIGSGDTVMKSAKDRDRTAEQENLIAFEMEGAGIWDTFRPECAFLVVKGVCDYADSHKNKIFQRYAAATAAACTKVLLEEWSRIRGPGLAASAKHQPHWMIPFKQNSKFVGRDSLLANLEGLLCERNGLESRVSIFGEAGVGKTHTAIELSYRLKNRFPHSSIFWVSASNAGAFKEAYRAIGYSLSLNGIQNEKGDVRLLVKTHLNRTLSGEWLMIVDDANDQHIWDSLLEFIPEKKGSVLLVTCSEEIAQSFASKNTIMVCEVDSGDAQQILGKLLTRKDIPNEVISQTSKNSLSNPLAVAQIAGYFNENFRAEVSQYLSELRHVKHEAVQVEKRGEFSRNRPEQQSGASPTFGSTASGTETSVNPAILTCLVSFRYFKNQQGFDEKFQKRNRLAADYLSFMSCLSPNNIPRSILPAATSNEQENAIALLVRLSFIRVRNNSNIDIHLSVHSVIRRKLSDEGRFDEWVRKVVERLDQVLNTSKENKVTWRIYTPHLEYVFGHSRGFQAANRNLLSRYGCYLLQDRNYKMAVEPLKLALEMERLAFGRNHLNTLCRMGNLALAYVGQENWQEAKNLFVEVTKKSEMIWGKEHAVTIKSMEDLLTIYTNRNEWDQAEHLLLEIIELKKRNLTAKELRALENIAHDKINILDYLAAPISKSSNNVSRDTLTTMDRLASVYGKLGKWKEATGLLQEIVKGRFLDQGPNHTNTLNSVKNLAISKRKIGEIEEAIRLLEAYVQGLKGTCGSRDPCTKNADSVLNGWKRELWQPSEFHA